MEKIFWKIYPKLIKIITWIIYGIFLFYILYLIYHSQNLLAKLIFGSTGFIILSFVILFEFLKNIYQNMIAALTVDCNLLTAKTYRLKLIKYDLFRGFKQSIALFDALLLLDDGAFNACLKHLEKNKKLFHSTLDYLFIEHRTKLQCAYFLGDSILFSEASESLKKLEYLPLKKKKINPIYSWEEINGLRYYHATRYTKSKNMFKKVAIERLNNREKAYLFFEQAQTENKLKHNTQFTLLLKDVSSIGNQLYIVTLAKKKVVII